MGYQLSKIHDLIYTNNIYQLEKKILSGEIYPNYWIFDRHLGTISLLVFCLYNQKYDCAKLLINYNTDINLINICNKDVLEQLMFIHFGKHISNETFEFLFDSGFKITEKHVRRIINDGHADILRLLLERETVQKLFGDL